MSNLKHDVYIQISYKLLYMSHLPMNSHTGLIIFTINYTLYILHSTQGIWSWTRTKTADKVSDRDVTSINAAVVTKNDHYLFANWFWKIARVTRSNKVNIILIIQPPSPSSWFRLCCHQTYSRFPGCYSCTMCQHIQPHSFHIVNTREVHNHFKYSPSHAMWEITNVPASQRRLPVT